MEKCRHNIFWTLEEKGATCTAYQLKHESCGFSFAPAQSRVCVCACPVASVLSSVHWCSHRKLTWQDSNCSSGFTGPDKDLSIYTQHWNRRGGQAVLYNCNLRVKPCLSHCQVTQLSAHCCGFMVNNFTVRDHCHCWGSSAEQGEWQWLEAGATV